MMSVAKPAGTPTINGIVVSNSHRLLLHTNIFVSIIQDFCVFLIPPKTMGKLLTNIMLYELLEDLEK